VGIHIFVFEIRIELFRDGNRALVGLGEDGREGQDGNALVLLVCLGAFLREAFGSNEVGFRECAGPRREEDVVFEVWSSNVGDRSAEGGDSGLDGWSECDRGEDCKATGRELHYNLVNACFY